jgi:hypothetical protein
VKRIRRLRRRDKKRAVKTQKSQSDFCVLTALKTFLPPQAVDVYENLLHKKLLH